MGTYPKSPAHNLGVRVVPPRKDTPGGRKVVSRFGSRRRAPPSPDGTCLRHGFWGDGFVGRRIYNKFLVLVRGIVLRLRTLGKRSNSLCGCLYETAHVCHRAGRNPLRGMFASGRRGPSDGIVWESCDLWQTVPMPYAHSFINAFIHSFIHTGVHAYMHTHVYVDTHMHVSIHAYIHAYSHKYMLSCKQCVRQVVQSYRHTDIRTNNNTSIQSYMHNIIHIYPHMQVHIQVHVHIHVHVYGCVSLHASVYKHISIYRDIDTFPHMNSSTFNVQTHIYVLTRTHLDRQIDIYI